MKEWLGGLSWSTAGLWGIFGTVAAELLTILFRFGFGLTASRDTAVLARFTFGVRLHHGYFGLLLLLLAFLVGRDWLRKGFFIIGSTLFLSDLVHHFIVLKWATGNPEFDLFYPDQQIGDTR